MYARFLKKKKNLVKSGELTLKWGIIRSFHVGFLATVQTCAGQIGMG